MHVDIFNLCPQGLGFCGSWLQRLPSSGPHFSLPRLQVRDQSQIVRDACAAQAAAQLLRGPEGEMNLGAGDLLNASAGAGAQKNGMLPSLHHRMRVQCLTSQQDNLQSVAHESGDLCSHMRVRVQEAGKGILPRF